MKNKYQNILRGMGSIMDIMPQARRTDYSRFIPKETLGERMLETWARVGNSLITAMAQYAHERQEDLPKERR